MQITKSEQGRDVWSLVQELQLFFRDGLRSCDPSDECAFEKVSWLRDEGQHGGGWRFVATEGGVFNRASINISQVQYDDMPEKPLQSATAISTIVHPSNPLAPSTHMHFSWTSLKGGKAYWRLMADLNPANPIDVDQDAFHKRISELAGGQLKLGLEQGDKYFQIPELGRTRGVSHFYLEQFDRGDFHVDYNFTRDFALGMMDCYCGILRNALLTRTDWDRGDERIQLDYHTLYLFQVLTLDRGTTTGILAHQQNDLGIMGSLPKIVDKALLQSWVGKLSDEKKPLLQGIVDGLEESGAVDDAAKFRLVKHIRQFYQESPKVLDMQASGFVLPTTVSNHSS